MSAAALRLLKAWTPEWIKSAWRNWRWPHRLLRWLPGTSQRFGPARHWTTLADYLRCNPGQMREVLARQNLPRPEPVVCGEVPQRFFSRFQTSVPSAAVATLPDVRLLAADGWIVGAGDAYLRDCSFWAYPDDAMRLSDHYMLRRRRAPPLRLLSGRTLSLASDFAIGGFGHWLHDSLTRLCLIELAGLNLTDFDWVYWPRPDSVLVRQIVQETGIATDKLLTHDPRHDLQCEELTATTFPGRPGQIAAVYAEFIRRRFALAPCGAPRRILLSRRGWRRSFSNESEVLEVLARYGFEEILAHQEADIRRVCADAEMVVSAEGANFFNVVFCQPGTRVLLILPDRLHDTPYAMTLAQAAGLPCWVMAGVTQGGPDVDPGIADIHVDPQLLRTSIEQMLLAQ